MRGLSACLRAEGTPRSGRGTCSARQGVFRSRSPPHPPSLQRRQAAAAATNLAATETSFLRTGLATVQGPRDSMEDAAQVAAALTGPCQFLYAGKSLRCWE